MSVFSSSRHSEQVQHQLHDDLESRCQRERSELFERSEDCRAYSAKYIWIPDQRSALPPFSGMTRLIALTRPIPYPNENLNV
jgi:hypothetical protein